MRSLVASIALAVVLAGCGTATSSAPSPTASNWSQVLAEAKGQTVNWWLYGGDAATNAFVEDYVAPAAAKLGVTVKRVPVSDTVDAVDRVVAERRAGETSGGAVDLIWINGENFVEGKEAGLWLRNWAQKLPNSRYVDWSSPIINRDFQVPVEGQESPWQGAAFIYGYDSAAVASPPRSFPALLAWAKAHPGRFTYPAPPDFTGAAFVRQVIQRLGGVAKGLRFLRELKPYQFEGGTQFPTSIDELDQLFANGQVDFDMSYNASFLNLGVKKGEFPPTVRPFLIGGALENTSYVTIPADAAHVAGAEVVANLLLDPRLQAKMADPAVLGTPSVLDPARLPAARAAALRGAASRSPYLLTDLGRPLGELPATRDVPIEEAWKREVLR
ncbi:MAG: ABC transporter substrate-binding protein [Actinobacteria bacterium]|nr:ABC transporter substrate-binding protein [Actinomycetota bacterium]